MELSTVIDQPDYASIGISHETNADRADRSVRTNVPPIDALIGGLKPRTMTLIDSADRLVFDMVNMMSVNAVSQNHDEVIWVDGGNSANPFQLTAVCKRFRLSSDEVLPSVTLSRAFTAYQMSTLIEDMLEKEVERIRTGMVVISCFPDPFSGQGHGMVRIVPADAPLDGQAAGATRRSTTWSRSSRTSVWRRCSTGKD